MHPLPITLRTNIEWLVDERDDSLEVDGTVVLQFETVARHFLSKRPAIEELYRTFALYRDPEEREGALEYYEDFWSVVSDPAEFADEILDDCVPLP